MRCKPVRCKPVADCFRRPCECRNPPPLPPPLATDPASSQRLQLSPHAPFLATSSPLSFRNGCSHLPPALGPAVPAPAVLLPAPLQSLIAVAPHVQVGWRGCGKLAVGRRRQQVGRSSGSPGGGHGREPSAEPAASAGAVRCGVGPAAGCPAGAVDVGRAAGPHDKHAGAELFAVSFAVPLCGGRCVCQFWK